MSGMAVIVNRLSACPFRLSTCSFSSHQLHVSCPRDVADVVAYSSSVTRVRP